MPPRRRGPQVPYRAVADALRARLDAGEWLPGEALPGTRVLAAEYGVSHATISRAVDVLVQESRLTVVRGWGTFVAER
jgi:GntR family transcriptional regulator